MLNAEKAKLKSNAENKQDKFTIKVKPISKFTIYDTAHVEKLTVSDNSHMSAFLHWVEARHFMKRYGVRFDDIKGFVAKGFIGKNRGASLRAIGWALFHYQTKKPNVVVVSVYVDAIHRRKGYGQQLFAAAEEQLRKVDKNPNLIIKHYAFDTGGNKFYNKCQLGESSIDEPNY